MGSLPTTIAPRLDVRLHGGRAISYALSGEFVVGGAAGCDLRLPGSDLPPVVAHFTQAGSAVRVRRMADAPLLLNDRTIPDTSEIELSDGDRLTLGPVQITLASAAATLIHPKLVPIEVLASEDDFELRQAALDEQARELEEDRRIWYARRQEMEAELLRMRAEIANRDEAHNGTIAQREDELAKHRAELNSVRASLTEEYETKRDELARMLETVRAESAALMADRSELEERGVAFDAELQRKRAEAEHGHAARMREVEAEIARKRFEFETDVQNSEPRFVQLRLERERTDAERQLLESERQTIQELRADLASERKGLDAERQWQIERIEKLESDLAGREADLARREELFRAERTQYESTRGTYQVDLVRLDRWQATLEQSQAAIDARAAEVDERALQMRRAAADLEEQLLAANTENDRLRTESERLDRLRTEIESQAGKFAERSAQVEAQQAMLAVLRAKLDRQQSEMRAEAESLALEKQQQESLRDELDLKLRDAELLQAELGFLRDDHASKHHAVQEQRSLLETTLDEIRRQKDEIAAAESRLKEREDALEAQASLTSEQAATLKAKLLQSLDLQQRLEADRAALREREAAMAEAEAARQTLQEQLRKRADELGGRGKNLDATAREVAEEKARLENSRTLVEEWQAKAEREVTAFKRKVDDRAAEVERQTSALVEREAALNRQIAGLKEVSATLARERKELFELRQAWEEEQSARQQQVLAARHESEAFKSRVAEQVAELRRQTPDVEQRANAVLENLGSAREMLRNQLAELHDFAKRSRQGLLAESEQLRQREQLFEQARAEHQHTVDGYRQQILDWQAKVAELRQSMNQSDTRTVDRQADLDGAARRLEQAQKELARREAELIDEQRTANEKRNEMERHLADMREWYRKKLRDLASGRSIDDSDMPAWDLRVAEEPAAILPMTDADPGDTKLGEILRSRGLIDDATLLALANESRRQRKTLRQTLLASGVVTVYQLALIEAGNLDGLKIDRFRVFDRLRSGPRENAWRVFDPKRPGEALVLRVLENVEDRSRFVAATAAHHANLVNVLEVLDIQGRAAVLLEMANGAPSSDWPPLATTPGVWLRLMIDAASAIEHIHTANIVHGRLGAESFLLTNDGTLKIAGLGEPIAEFAPLPAADLRALGRVAYAWSQIGAKRRGSKGKPFPAELAAIVRRLEAGAESAMDDIIALERPYANATELHEELMNLQNVYPCPDEAWNRLLKSLRDGDDELRQTA